LNGNCKNRVLFTSGGYTKYFFGANILLDFCLFFNTVLVG
jgi:hypothetical protein